MPDPSKASTGHDLLVRAAKCIPGGIYGHTSPAVGLPGDFPCYAHRGSGCRYLDVDGREFIDFMCAYGPLVLGFHHPEVEEAAARQREKGSCFNHPAPVMVELAELLTSRIDFAHWAVFGKNGSDMTTWAIQVAREATGRRKVLKVKGAYHGVDPWCTPGHGGLIAEDRTHIHEFNWNDLEGFQRVLAEHTDDLAAVVLTPYHHPSFAASEMPAPGFHHSIREACSQIGALLILDDIRTGFRLHENGSHPVFGIEPDLACYCKAMANGYPISATLGREELRQAAGKVFLTGSYWNNAEAMAAALTCLEIIRRDRIPDRINVLGQRLARGLEQAGSTAGFPVRSTGPASAPYLVFDDDPSFLKIQAFCQLALRQGLFFHPHHNWFLSAAHDEEVIDLTLHRVKTVFSRLPEALEERQALTQP